MVPDEDATMSRVVGGILGCSHSDGLPATCGEILAGACVLLLVQMGFNEDVKLALPIPFNDLFAKAGAVGEVETHGICIGLCSLAW